MSAPTQAPVLSTPDESHIFEDPTPISAKETRPKYTNEELWDVYEIPRTAREVCEGGYRRVALQFPDGMLRDAPRVVGALEKEVLRVGKKRERISVAETGGLRSSGGHELETSFNALAVTSAGEKEREERIRFYILGDTSYGSCCVDEIAAEHAAADVVVHYGRSCLSPTARLPVIYVFTSHPLSVTSVVESFEATFPDKEERVVLMADITYHMHVSAIWKELEAKGYKGIVIPEVIHDPESVIPNRRIEEMVKENLREYNVFHISDPPTALLLTLDSRVKGLFIYPTTTSSTTLPSPTAALTPQSQTRLLLRRRYALLTRLSTCPIFGILINTLSVKNYLSTVTSLQRLIASQGKKSYTFVVGKVNAAKVANFAEIGGWVVVGCWESSLVESSEFYRPLVTPFELGMCLQGDSRVWDGRWEGGFGGVEALVDAGKEETVKEGNVEGGEEKSEEIPNDDDDSEPESAPPEFDLRTGRYISHTRPMAYLTPSTSSRAANSSSISQNDPISTSTPTSTEPEATSSNTTSTAASHSLIKRAKHELATINGSVSPGAEFLRSQRTWTGLGSDFVDADADAGGEGEGGKGESEGIGGRIEEGRRGVARGYVVGEDEERR